MDTALPPGIRWTSSTEFVDIDTGEVLTRAQSKHNYIKIKTTKHAELNHIKSAGHIKYTVELRRNPQTELFQTDSKKG